MALPTPPLSKDEVRLYDASPVHVALFNHDYGTLNVLLAAIPRPPPHHVILTEQASVAAEDAATEASRVVDFRDVPGRESPLCLAVRLRDPVAVQMLMAAGGDVSLQVILSVTLTLADFYSWYHGLPLTYCSLFFLPF